MRFDLMKASFKCVCGRFPRMKFVSKRGSSDISGYEISCDCGLSTGYPGSTSDRCAQDWLKVQDDVPAALKKPISDGRIVIDKD